MICALLAVCLFSLVRADDCNGRKFQSESIVCVCDTNYCDTISVVKSLPRGEYVKYTSSLSGLRFHKFYGEFVNEQDDFIEDFVRVNPLKHYEKVVGWGGSFTDAAGINIQSLSYDVQTKLMRSYYSTDGLEYTMGRVPIGGTDASTRQYTYDDVPNDVNLTKFQLQQEDYNLKIPVIKWAQQLSNNSLKIIASPWTAPPWMKTNNRYESIGILKKQYYQLYADYYVKFLDAYNGNGVNIWGITTGNEPFNGLIPLPLPTLGWKIKDMTRWVANNLGPTIRNSKFNRTKIIVHDDQKMLLPQLQLVLFNNPKALQYTDGVAFHWYFNFLTPPNFVNFAKTPKKDLFILSTEASTGFLRYYAVELGSWIRAEEYANDIIDDFEFGTGGWIDWSIATDMQGGPIITNYPVDATIVVNAAKNEFYKQPTYYAMGHFSKFLPPDSVRVEITNTYRDVYVKMLAFRRPDDGIAIIIHNRDTIDVDMVIVDDSRGHFKTKIQAKSINTLLYW